MEQYFLPKRLDFKHLRKCINNYPPDHLFIRSVGTKGGTVKIYENLDDKVLDFRKDQSGLYMLIDAEDVFHFPLKDYDKGFTLAYERFEQADGYDRMIMLSHGIDPNDENLPEPRRSFLRTVLDDHLMEIYFKGKIPLQFHSWMQKPHWKLYTIP